MIRALPQPILHRVVPRPLDVEGATRRIEALLHERDRFSFRDALGAAPTVADVISTLLAILELARVYVNGGRRGFLVSLAPAELVRVLAPQLVEVALED